MANRAQDPVAAVLHHPAISKLNQQGSITDIYDANFFGELGWSAIRLL
jgi:hypothetical protein